MAVRRVNVVPHTHWDREWYLPFQRFRARLVELLDDLLDRLEADPGYAHFLLDGQMAVLDDYLAIRPEAAPRIDRLARTGRIAMGPWYTLPDEFLVSGETLVRDLQTGIDRAERFGGAMQVGYLPDMFGHVAQMPQILLSFGFEHAVVWRGIPAAIQRTGFWWSGPDGSRVRAEYLPTGYGNGAAMPREPAAIEGRLSGWEDEVGTLLHDDDAILWMNGSDHRTPQAFLPHVIDDVNRGGRYEMRITPLATHLAQAATDGLPEWHGELRSSFRANLLMGVASNRVDVRVAVGRAERALELLAEPLAALLLPAARWPTALLDEAWLAMLRNAAHDSVCACSDDEVVDAVLHRYAEARQIAEAVEEHALRHFGDQLGTHGTVVVNPSPRPRSGLVEVTVPGHEPIPGSQVLRLRAIDAVLFDGPCATALPVLTETAGWTDDLSGITVDDDGETVTVTLHADGSNGTMPPARGALATRLEREPAERHVRGLLRRPASHRALVHVADVPGYGWAPVPRQAAAETAVRVDGNTLSNGLVTVSVSHHDGTLTLDGVAGMGRLVDGGDAGDTYNWCPPTHDTVIEGPESVHVHMGEDGPLRASIDVDAVYCWPRRVADGTGRRIGEERIDVRTTLALHAGERFVRVTQTVDNRAEDHRLRAHFPLPSPATSSRAECAFAVVERGLTAEGGPTECGVPTFPSRRFVQAGALTIVHEGLAEYELIDIGVDGARTLALTVLRATRYLSRGPMATRPLPAGPIAELHGSQMLGRHTLRYAISVDPTVAPYAMVDDAFTPLRAVAGAGSGPLPDNGQLLRVDGAVEVSSLRRHNGTLELRVFNPAAEAATLVVDGRAGSVVDLAGRELGVFDGEAIVAPFGIVTLRLAE